MTTYQDFGLYTRFCFFIICFGILNFIFGMMCNFSSTCLTFTAIIAFILSFLALFTDLIVRNYKKGAGKIKGNIQKQNKMWLHENYDDIIKKYENHFVAVFEREIVDTDKELFKLKQRMQNKNLKNVYIEFVNPKEVHDSYKKLAN